ncbi:hypothetical protein CF326_g9621 [Tilletia indica]|nr:hypothetical protein CF326_g9621 [Tilletia indica]
MPVNESLAAPFVSSIPAALQQHISTLQGSHENCGRLTTSLVRLDHIKQYLEDTVARHISGLQVELSRLQQDVSTDHHRMDTAVAHLREYVLRLQENIDDQKQRTVDRLSSVSTALSGSSERDFTAVVKLMKTCSTDFGRDIRLAETDLIRVESQLVGLNAWNVAW